MSVILLTHIFACMWIAIGKLDEDHWVINFMNHIKEETGNQNLTYYDYYIEIYASAFYFVLTTITTVGYGDITGQTTTEYAFSMFIEFVGLTFFSLMSGTVSVMFSGSQTFESLINQRMEQLDLWLLRLENCNKQEKIPN